MTEFNVLVTDEIDPDLHSEVINFDHGVRLAGADTGVRG